MAIKGGCYCGAIRYEAGGDAIMKASCHCRECQYFTGGQANTIMAMPTAEFRYTLGTPKGYRRADLERGALREFCSDCGTHIATRSPSLPQAVILKVGTLDDPSVFGAAQMAMQVADAQSFHHVPDDIARFERFPANDQDNFHHTRRCSSVGLCLSAGCLFQRRRVWVGGGPL